ncbi:MAG: DUF917 domain-containing protein [Bacillota bacterium]
MAKVVLNEDILQAAVAGGSFYGGGGGGSPALGLRLGRLALGLESEKPLHRAGASGAEAPSPGASGRPGRPWMISLDEVPDDAILLTVSAVGSPAGKGHHAGPEEYARAVDLFCRQTGIKVAGLITNECGGLATVNGWIQSAATGLPIVDAPCNGRAHPTGTMGSMGLHLDPHYESLQTVVGGSREDGTYLEVLIRGNLEFAGNVVRQAAAQAGGLVAVARNPVTAAYARDYGAIGAVAKCVEVGREMISAPSAEARIAATARASGGTVAVRGVVAKKELVSAGGFDTGTLVVKDEDSGENYEITFWNEYITLERLGAAESRLATFPDLIATIDAESGYPVSSADVKEGQRVAVVTVPASMLLLGAGVKDPGLYAAVERTVGKEVIKYAFGS